MPYKIDFFDGEVVEWSLTDDGATSERVLDYTPTFYVGAGEGDDESLRDAQRLLEQFPTVARTDFEEWRPGFRHDAEWTLRVDCTAIEEVTRLARWVHERGYPGEYRCFNVDFSREFRYCLEENCSPTPARELTTLSIEGQPHEFEERELPPLRVGGEQVGHSPARYNVPGRVILDLSNTFFYRETNLAGCVDLVRRSGKPLQELSWASIGNVLTAIQIREALSRNVLVPWQAWRPEQCTPIRRGQSQR